MPDLPKNPDREQLREYYEESGDAPTECWENYGDANPAAHGGGWVHYDGGWDHIGTFVAEEVGYPEDEYDVDDPIEAQYVYWGEVHWRDIVTEDGEWTDEAQRTIDSIHGAHATPAGAVVDGRLTWFVAAFADEVREGYPRHDPVHTGEYEDILSSLGVEPCEGEL